MAQHSNPFFQNATATGGNTLGDYYRQILANFAQQRSDPRSQFYQQYRSFLGSTTPTQGANTLLAGLQSGGGNFGASQVQAQASQRGFEGRRTDSLNTSTQGFFLQNIQGAQDAIGTAAASDFQQQALTEQVRSNRANEPGFLDGLGTVAAIGLAPFTGGASLLAIPAMQAGRSSRGAQPAQPPGGGQQANFNLPGSGYDQYGRF